jgi:hypothetical protein
VFLGPGRSLALFCSASCNDKPYTLVFAIPRLPLTTTYGMILSYQERVKTGLRRKLLPKKGIEILKTASSFKNTAITYLSSKNTNLLTYEHK